MSMLFQNFYETCHEKFRSKMLTKFSSCKTLELNFRHLKIGIFEKKSKPQSLIVALASFVENKSNNCDDD